jgi:pentatricopeptide repeat protein
MAIRGFCKLERMLEVLRVLREMAMDEVVVGEDMRKLVYRGLLQEARIDEARELDLVLGRLEENCSGNEFVKAREMLDRLISEWED